MVRRARSLSVRLPLLYSLIVAATLLVVAGTALLVVRSHFEGVIDSQLQAAARSFERGPAAHARTPAELLHAARVWLAEQPRPSGQMAAVRVGDRVLTSAGDLDMFEVRNPRRLLASGEPRWWDTAGDDGGVRGETVPLHAGGRQIGTLVLLAYKEKAQQAVAAVLTAIGVASGIGVLLAALLGFTLVRRSLRPLARITGEIEGIEAAGDLSRRVAHARGGDEVGRLAAAFDRMLERLERSFRAQQRLVADAAHELRTPLTVARGRLEILAGDLDDTSARVSLDIAADELDRMARIVEDLLLLAQLDEGLALRREPVEVELVVREALLRAILLEERRVHVQTHLGVYALADSDRLLQALTNLIVNAVQHTDDSARVTVSSALADGRVVLRVSDTGEGIPARDLPHVFERLYRGARARSGRAGAGLGLAITASLVKAMGGTVDVSSLEHAGTTFTITLPAAADHAGLASRQDSEAGAFAVRRS